MQDDNMNNLSASPTPQVQPSTEPVESIEAVSVQQDVNITHANEPEPTQPMPTVQLGQSAEPTPIRTDQTASLEGTSINTPVVSDVTANNTTEPVKKNNKALAIVLSVVAALVVVAAVVVAIVMLMGGKKDSALSIADVENYCNSNSYEVAKQFYDEYGVKGDMIACTKREDKTSSIQYIVLDKSSVDDESLKEFYSAMNAFGSGYLVNEDDYKKMYFSIFGMTGYVVLKDGSILTVSTSSNDDAKKILLDLGYPDDKWGEGSSMDIDYDFDFNLNDDEDEDDNNKPSIIQDTQNLNDSNIDDSYFVSDDTKYVLTIDGDFFDGEEGDAPSAVKMYVVFGYSGDTITSAILYQEYDSEAVAQIAYNYYKTQDMYDEVENVYVDGRYLVAEMPREYYEDMSVDEIKEQIELMEALDAEDMEDYESLFESYGELYD